MAESWRHLKANLDCEMGSMVFGVMIASEIVPTFLEVAFSLVEMEFCEQDGLWCCSTLEGFLCEPWAMLVGHLVLPEGWYGVRQDLQHWKFAEYPERWVER